MLAALLFVSPVALSAQTNCVSCGSGQPVSVTPDAGAVSRGKTNGVYADQFTVQNIGPTQEAQTPASHHPGAVARPTSACAATLWARVRPAMTAVFIFYRGACFGGQLGTYPDCTNHALQGHVAPNDEWEPEEPLRAVEAPMKAAKHTADIYSYPNTKHWFFESNRPDAYNAEAAQLAWDRTIRFLNTTLKGEGNA